MKKVIIGFFLLSCIVLNIQCTSSVSDRMNKTNLLTSIGIWFSYKQQLRDDMIFAVYDSTHVDSVTFEPIIIHGYAMISHNKYLEFLAEIQRIKCINDTNVNKELFIEIDINERENLVERFRFRGISQIREYISISNRILGYKNFIPKVFDEK